MKHLVLIAALAAAPLAATAQDAAKPAAKKSAKPAAKGDTIATVNGVPVPSARMEFLVQQQKGRGAPDSDQTRSLIRDELINREVVVQEAQKSGLAKSPEVQTQLDIARQEIIVGVFLRDWVRKHPVTDAEIQKEYDRAKDLIAQIRKGAKFEDLATKHSKDTGSAQRGGDLDWSVPAAYDKQFSDAMVRLEKGKYTEQPVQSRFGYHVILLEDVRQTKFPALAEVKPRIQQQLMQHKVDELVRGLRAKAKVE
jgi:peptidyl-prolyl cis-trans isomerase C